MDRRDDFIGVFFVGVKTTSIFCIATCRARKPKKENVEFFSTFREALEQGYRPCKICKPTQNANQKPEQVDRAIQLVRENPKERVTDHDLRRVNISPEAVRRWFNTNYGMTFQAFQRMYRINNAFQELQKGKNTTHAAFDSGYESLSGFGYTFKKVMGGSPQKSMDRRIILICRITTPLGPMFICSTEKGICLLEFVDRRMLETEFKDLQRLLHARILAGENTHIKRAKKQLAEYFSGKRKEFDVQLELPGTDFQKLVWRALLEINYGQLTNYQLQAKKIGRPKAVRAVASANGQNRVSIIIPCHRVTGKNGKLTGYGGGLERKQWLLDHERSHVT